MQRRLLDIYHTDLAIGTITDEAGGALYGPDKLADLSMVAGAVLRASWPLRESLDAAGATVTGLPAAALTGRLAGLPCG